MRSIDWLIEFYGSWEKDCATCRDRAADNDRAKVTDKRRRQIIAEWEDQRRIARDTVAYLKTIKRRGLAKAAAGVSIGTE